MTNARGVLPEDTPPPDRQLLLRWLADHDIHVSDAVEICESALGGWGVKAKRTLMPDHLLLAVPKTSILSARTTSLVLPPDLRVSKPDPADPMGSVKTNHTIPTLALVLLHEFRLGAEGEFWGYVQSLPREVEGLPMFWPEDGEARRWLKGTEAERELVKRDREGMALSDLRRFYETTKHILPPTTSHPAPSPVEAFLHAYALVTTRAFLIDLYHTLAFVPFADILNHSSHPDTSLASDDFVCHICGALAPCAHDASGSASASGDVPSRLSHLDPKTRERLEKERDTVDMRIERKVDQGHEVMNTYGEGIGDGRMLVEWGFVAGGHQGDGIVWTLEDVLDDLHLREVWEGVINREKVAWAVFPPASRNRARPWYLDYEDGHETDHWRLIAPPAPAPDPKMRMLNLDHDGQVSLNIWIAHALPLLSTEHLSTTAKLDEALIRMYKHFDHVVSGRCNSDPDPVVIERYVSKILQGMMGLLRRRLEGMYSPDPDIALWELFDQRDVSPGPLYLSSIFSQGHDRRAELKSAQELHGIEHRDLRMAMTIALDERALLETPLGQMQEVLAQLW